MAAEATMRVTVLAQHAPHAERLQGLLGPGFAVVGTAALPSAGPIEGEVLVTTRLDAGEAARLQAKLVHAPGIGIDAIAVDALPPGCQLCNVGAHELPIAEFVTHAVLDHCIYPQAERAPMDAAHWLQSYLQRPFHGEAAGRHAAIVGFGAIGQAVAARLSALGLRTTAVTRIGAPVAGADAAHAVGDLPALLPSVDVLVLCCPLTAQTRGLLDARALAVMRSDALLINVGRAQLVQEQALYEALAAQRLGRAVLDVWYHYPQPGQTELAPSALPFHQLPNVRCTPHISGWTHGLLARRYEFIARNVQRLAQGQPLLNRVR